MSNTNAKSSDTAYYVKLSLTLLIISLVVAALLGVVNGVTAGPIETIKAEKKAAAMSVVMQDCTFEEVTASDEMSAAATGFESKIAGIYAATGADGSKAGYVLEVIPSGFGGDIDMMVGISAEGPVSRWFPLRRRPAWAPRSPTTRTTKTACRCWISLRIRA